MNVEEFRTYCLSKKGVTEGFPFAKFKDGEHVLVFKVGGKMFALTDLHAEAFKINLKCDPDWAQELRGQFSEIVGAYHMHKKHWNSVQLDTQSVGDDLVFKMIDHSYDLVFKSLTKKLQKEVLEA